MVGVQELKKFPLLSALPLTEQEELATLLQQKKCRKGSYVISRESRDSSLMFLASGSVKVTLEADDGKEVILATFGEGDFFGEITFLTGQERSANVVASTECELLVLSKQDFEGALNKHPHLVLALAQELARRLAAASNKIGDLALFDVYRRLSRTLKSLARPREENGKTVLVVDQRPTHQDLASMIGTSREMITRALKSLEEDERIEMRDKQIVLKDVQP